MNNNPLSEKVNRYIASFPPETQSKLQQIRAVIQKAAPAAVETISYRMPAYKQHGILVYFAGYKTHIGFYPTSSGIEHFKKDFTGFKWSKGAVQFPVDKPLPVSLIAKIVRFRVKDDQERKDLAARKNK